MENEGKAYIELLKWAAEDGAHMEISVSEDQVTWFEYTEIGGHNSLTIQNPHSLEWCLYELKNQSWSYAYDKKSR
jgi:hypothetical protein